MATLLWVKAPNLKPDLPRRRIVADSYALLAPTPALWQKYIEEVERLRIRGEITDSEVGALLYSYEAQRAVMDTTKGDPKKVGSDSIQATLTAAKEAISEPSRKQADKLREAVLAKEKALAHSKQMSVEIAERHVAELASMNDKVAALEGQVGLFGNFIAAKKSRIARRYRFVGRATTSFVWIAIAIGAVALFDQLFIDSRLIALVPKSVQVLVKSISMALGVIGMLGVWKQVEIQAYLTKMRTSALTRALEREGIQDRNSEVQVTVQDMGLKEIE